MDAAGQLAQLVEALGELLLRCGQELARGGRVLLEHRAGHAQVQRDRDEALLRAVVEVALQPPALGVARLDDAGARGGQLLVGVRVGQRLRDELGEVAQPLLVVVGQRVGRAGPRGQRAPQAAADAHRRRDRAAVPDALELRRRASLPRPRSPRAAGSRCAAPARRPCRRRGRSCSRPAAAAGRPRSSRPPPSPCRGPRSAPCSPRVPRAARRPPWSPARRRGSAARPRRPASRPCAAPPARPRARAGRASALRALGRHRGEHERRERGDGDEQLRREQAVGDRVAHERPARSRPSSRP